MNVFDYKQFCGMAAMAERLYCADFSRTGQDKYSQKESKVFLTKTIENSTHYKSFNPNK